MTAVRNRQVLLASRPQGWPTEDNFRFAESDLPSIADNQVLVRSHWLSLDPYMRGRMGEGRSYVKPVELGAVMCGEVIAEVVESKHPKFAVGDFVHGDLGWQLYAVSDGKGIHKLDPRIPLTAQLSVVGMAGLTAYFGLLDIGQPKPGETVVVSAAAGAVGGIVGQLAKIHGARAIGIAGGVDKCRFVVDELGFDACLDYKAGDLAGQLKSAAPKGVDVYFDNVGGEILDTVLGRMNPFSRLPMCGLISQYNATEAYGVKNIRSILVNRIRVQGFIVFDYGDRYKPALVELAQWLAAGRIKYRETVAQGLDAAPQAFLGLLRGENIGKQLVKLI
jgi:NADPH-dependent curcumin reductase CurA